MWQNLIEQCIKEQLLEFIPYYVRFVMYREFDLPVLECLDCICISLCWWLTLDLIGVSHLCRGDTVIGSCTLRLKIDDVMAGVMNKEVRTTQINASSIQKKILSYFSFYKTVWQQSILRSHENSSCRLISSKLAHIFVCNKYTIFSMGGT